MCRLLIVCAGDVHFPPLLGVWLSITPPGRVVHHDMVSESATDLPQESQSLALLPLSEHVTCCYISSH